MNKIQLIGINARKALNEFEKLDSKKINKVLAEYNNLIKKNKNLIIKKNSIDVKNVKRKHLVDRLILNDKKIDGIRH